MPWGVFPGQLTQIWLQGNRFTGCLPTGLQGSIYLETLYLDNNLLNCSLSPLLNLPASLKNLSLVSERVRAAGPWCCVAAAQLCSLACLTWLPGPSVGL